MIKMLFPVICCLLLTTHLHSQHPSLKGQIKKDNKGSLVNAHGGGFLYHNGTYYWFGEIKKGSTSLVPNQPWENFRVPAGGVSCYSSKDLVSWKNEGIALPSVKGNPAHDLDTSKVIERPKVVYNALTEKFVMWMHIDANDYSYARSGVAVSDRVTGPYKYLRSVRPNGQMARDMTLFKDEDNKAYLVYSSDSNRTMRVCLLSDDYLSPTTTYSSILVDRSREAPAMFKDGQKYYLVTSGCTGWSANKASYAVADRPLGPWVEYDNPCTGPGADSTFYAQSTFVLPVAGKKGQYIFMADRWNKLDLENSKYLWLPLYVREGKVIISGEPAAR